MQLARTLFFCITCLVTTQAFAQAVAVNNAGDIYVTGRSTGAGTGNDITTHTYVGANFCTAVPGDLNARGVITVADIIHLVNSIFDKDGVGCLGGDPGSCWTPQAHGACCRPVPRAFPCLLDGLSRCPRRERRVWMDFA